MNRLESLDWLPIELAQRDLRPGSEQIVVLYSPGRDNTEGFIEYFTSNPDYASSNFAIQQGVTEFAILVGA